MSIAVACAEEQLEMNAPIRLVVGLASLAIGPCCCFAQQSRQYTDAEYAHAEKFMGYNQIPLAYTGQVNAQWLDDDRFWYREVDSNGTIYIAVDPLKCSRAPLLDQK